MIILIFQSSLIKSFESQFVYLFVGAEVHLGCPNEFTFNCSLTPFLFCLLPLLSPSVSSFSLHPPLLSISFSCSLSPLSHTYVHLHLSACVLRHYFISSTIAIKLSLLLLLLLFQSSWDILSCSSGLKPWVLCMLAKHLTKSPDHI